eukprot:2107116-Alexandrium_andersonii.AAC.1
MPRAWKMLSPCPGLRPGPIPRLGGRPWAAGMVGWWAGGMGRRRVQWRGPLNLGGPEGGAVAAVVAIDWAGPPAGGRPHWRTQPPS